MLRSRLQLLHFIFILYSFQGIIYGLQVKYLPIILRTKGSSLIFIGSLNLLSLPWLFKTLWAPFIDLYWTTTTWLRLTITGVSTSLLFLHLTQHSLGMFAIVLVVLNVFSACQEVVISKVLLGGLENQTINTGSSIKVLAYKTGIVIGGGGMLWISSNFTHQVFPITAIICLLLLLLFAEESVKKPELPRDNQTEAKQEVKVINSNPALYEIYHSMSRGSKWLITCLLLYKYSSHSCHLLFTMELVDQGVGVDTIALTSGVVGHILSIAVALVVGIILSNNRSVIENREKNV